MKRNYPDGLDGRIARLVDDVRTAMSNDVPATLTPRAERLAFGVMMLSNCPREGHAVEFKTDVDDQITAWNADPDEVTTQALIAMGWHRPAVVGDPDWAYLSGTPAETWRFFV